MQETSDATAIFAPLWRRKWLILAVGIVVGVGSYFYYKHATPTFSASTQVYLGASAEEQAPGEKGQGKTGGAEVANQAAIINAIVIEQVRKELKREGNGEAREGDQGKSQGGRKKRVPDDQRRRPHEQRDCPGGQSGCSGLHQAPRREP